MAGGTFRCLDTLMMIAVNGISPRLFGTRSAFGDQSESIMCTPGPPPTMPQPTVTLVSPMKNEIQIQVRIDMKRKPEKEKSDDDTRDRSGIIMYGILRRFWAWTLTFKR